MKKLTVSLLLTVFILALACEEGEKKPPEFPLSALLATPDTLVYKNKRLVLKADIWYDKMPTIPETGPRFGALFTIFTADSSDIDFKIDIEAYYLIRNGEVFSGFTVDEDYPNNYPYKFEKIGRSGPSGWENQSVTVAVLVFLDGNQFLIKAENQFIGVAY
ncbi:hypothetical protein ACSSWA_13650 [Melioribacter sp. Ez-97]|uniref:hypothetical protein n=1 Tax=Melioribacter sp. Ez-97 TaxID=3423434 RepID=UPI003ED8AAE9